MIAIGRTVHYVSYGTRNGEYTPECRAAIITEVGQWVTVLQQEFPADPEPLGPSITQADGTVIHFVDGNGNPLTFPGTDKRTRVLVQEFHPEACSMSVHNPTGVFFNSGGVPIEHDETKKPGTWHWPEGSPAAQEAMAS